MIRQLTPEILDSLPAQHPDAQSSRRDLRIINRLMGSHKWFQQQLSRLTQDTNWLEIGAGDGDLAVSLVEHFKNLNYTAIDRIDPPDDLPPQIQWLKEDLFRSTGYAVAHTLLANLILHHFEDTALAELGARIQDSPIQSILVSEPCRRQLHKYQLAAGRLIGFNHVTLHDGAVSIEAGFLGDELPILLGLNDRHWDIKTATNWMGCYRMVATRR
ncbi:MAG: hypothetical protein ACI81V_000301 [Lentimonas sp.]|jgi:hypothetical protein